VLPFNKEPLITTCSGNNSTAQISAQVISTTAAPSPNIKLNTTADSIVSISDPPLLAGTNVGAGVGVVVALMVALPVPGAIELELVFGTTTAGVELAGAPVGTSEVCDDVVSSEGVVVEEPGADGDCEDDGGAEVEGGSEAGVVDEAGGVVVSLELVLELEPPAGTTTPPCTCPADCDDEVPAALSL
jgi:hypothetical protein